MKKLLHIFSVFVSAALLVYGAFVTVDCVRLYRAKKVKSPLITVQIIEREDCLQFCGVGYTVNYHIKKIPTESGFSDKSENESGEICGAQFKMFDKILFWTWIE